MKYNKYIIIIFLLSIGFSLFVQIPCDNMGYKLYITPPATSIKSISIENGKMLLTIDSTTIQMPYNGINSLIEFLNEKFPIDDSKVILTIKAPKNVSFLENSFMEKQFLTESGWKYCRYEDLLFVFALKRSSTIFIPIPKFRLTINSLPEAYVFLNKKFIGKTPLSTSIYCGKYDVNLKSTEKQYDNLHRIIYLNKNLNLNLKLEKLRKITVTANTKRYTVMINGIKKGKEFYLNNGKYLLTITATGFYSINKTIEIKSDKTFHFELKPKIFTLNITTLKDAEIFIDKLFIGKGEINLSLNSGKHEIFIKANGFIPIEKTIDLEKNEKISFVLSPLPGTIITSYNIKNAIFAQYANNTLTVFTKENILTIDKKIALTKNMNYSYMYDDLLIDLSGKIGIKKNNFYVEPFITGVVKYKSFYIISTSCGNIYTFNGTSAPILIKNLSTNFTYLKIISYNQKIFALSSDGKIYEMDIGRGKSSILISERYIKDFSIKNGMIYVLSNNKVDVYIKDRKLKTIVGNYDYLYENMAYGKSVLNIDKNKIIGKCELKSSNSALYYYDGKIFDPINNDSYNINTIPIKILKFDGYAIIISKEKVEVMKL